VDTSGAPVSSSSSTAAGVLRQRSRDIRMATHQATSVNDDFIPEQFIAPPPKVRYTSTLKPCHPRNLAPENFLIFLYLFYYVFLYEIPLVFSFFIIIFFSFTHGARKFDDVEFGHVAFGVGFSLLFSSFFLFFFSSFFFSSLFYIANPVQRLLNR